MRIFAWTAVVIAVVALVAWYLSYTAARLDRLHTKVEGSVSSLDAQLVRRAEVVREVAGSGALDPASAALLADAASASLTPPMRHHWARRSDPTASVPSVP
ncbi:hypothetical protein [Flexivirga alba]|uniref:Uncharacterized protein n=1 Tax=Flexivirga alba TaxID=702742 RepID=A0ABW2AJ65_9MICO